MSDDVVNLSRFAPTPDPDFDPADRVAKLKRVKPDASGVLVIPTSRYRGEHPVHIDGVRVFPAGRKRYSCTDHEWTVERSDMQTTTDCCDSAENLRVARAND